MSEKERPGFEKALKRLETIVKKLDDESLSLEKSIELYEEGVMLSKQCSQTLEEAELRIKKVNEEHSES
jgi:exodeoxyribonuclease VII small subunit